MEDGNFKVTDISSLKKGSYVIVDGVACITVDTQTSKPGKHGHAKVRLTAVGMLDGKKREIVKSGHENVNVPIIEKKNAQVLSVVGEVANVMDTDTFETFDMKIPEELTGTVTDGAVVLYWIIMNDKVMKQVKSQGE